MCRAALTAAVGLVSGLGWTGDHAVSVLDYGPGPMAAYTDPSRALGAPSTAATPTIPDNSAIVSLGFGGSLTLGFDRPIYDDPTNPGRYDFIVFGNAFYSGGDIFTRFQEPAVVEVGVDMNANGYDASDPFYRLAGSSDPQYSFGGIDERTTGPTWGYADVTPTNGSGDPLLFDNPLEPGLSAGSAGGDPMDLAWAIDSAGTRVQLQRVDFVRITSPPNWSADIDAVSIVRYRVSWMKSHRIPIRFWKKD